MNLRTVNHIRTSLLVVMIIALIFSKLAGVDSTLGVVCLVISMVAIVAEIVIYILYWRCPYCGKPLRRVVIKHCEYCGASLKDDL